MDSQTTLRVKRSWSSVEVTVSLRISTIRGDYDAVTRETREACDLFREAMLKEALAARRDG